MRQNSREPRVFYSPDAGLLDLPGEGNDPVVDLSPEEAHHAAKVLRLREGERVRLFDGAGCFYGARIVGVDRRRVSVAVEGREASEAEPRAHLTLMVGMLKGRKNDLLIQKSVELGVGELVFFPAERSVARGSGGDAEEADAPERVERIVVAACKQCGRATLMPVRLCGSLDAALAALPDDGGARYVFWEDCDARAGAEGRPAGTERTPTGSVVALIGPEGGFPAGEIAQLRAAGFVARSLGARILRAETAALAVAAILLHGAGELGPRF